MHNMPHTKPVKNMHLIYVDCKPAGRYADMMQKLQTLSQPSSSTLPHATHCTTNTLSQLLVSTTPVPRTEPNACTLLETQQQPTTKSVPQLLANTNPLRQTEPNTSALLQSQPSTSAIPQMLPSNPLPQTQSGNPQKNLKATSGGECSAVQ